MLDLQRYPVSIRMLALSAFARVSPRVFDHLLGSLGSLDEIFFAEAADLAKIDGLAPAQQRQIEEVDQHLDQAVQLETVLAAQGIEIISRYDDRYRRTLFELNDPPLLFYVRGKMPITENPTLGLIGPVIASQTGMSLAADTVRRLAKRSIAIVSSLRGGIDAAILLSAKNAEVPVAAVTDGGIDEPLGEDVQLLYKELLVSGAVITEYLKSDQIVTPTYEQANRLIAGLCDGVAISECHASDLEVLDLIACCEQIGKLCFLLVDENFPDLIDPTIRKLATKAGAVPISVRDGLDDLVRVLV